MLQQVVEGLPKDDKQTVRVLTASFKPGDKTVHHTHRFPVTVYVLEGAFTLELEGRPPVDGEGRRSDGRAAERGDDRLQSQRDRNHQGRDLLVTSSDQRIRRTRPAST